MGEHPVEGAKIGLTLLLDLRIGDLLGGAGEHRCAPLGLLEALDQMLGQFGQGSLWVEQQPSRIDILGDGWF